MKLKMKKNYDEQSIYIKYKELGTYVEIKIYFTSIN